MTRLGILLAVLAAPALECGWVGYVATTWSPHEIPERVLAPTIGIGLHMAGVVVVIVETGLSGKLTPRSALRIAWSLLVLPALGVARVARWVARGD